MRIYPRLTTFLSYLFLLFTLNLSAFSADSPPINCHILLEENQLLLQESRQLRKELQASLALGLRMRNQLEKLLQIQTMLLQSMQTKNRPKTPQ